MVTAIPTRYAGRYFRSRLEARWARFFDAMKIPWQYEVQGLLVRDRLEPWSDAPARPYLPDFLLPEHNLWVEVKGHLTKDEMWVVLNNAAYLSSNGGAGCHDSGGNDMLLLGDIPRPDRPTLPPRLHMHKGMLLASAWQGEVSDNRNGYCGSGGWDETDVAGDTGETFNHPERWLLRGFNAPTWTPQLRRAFAAASEEQFEYRKTG